MTPRNQCRPRMIAHLENSGHRTDSRTRRSRFRPCLDRLEERSLMTGVGFGWAFGLGSSGGDEGHDVAADAQGNSYVTGTFSGTIDFDPGPGVYALSSP